MASTKPTIVLIPGSFCSAALMWDAVIDKLHHVGYDALAVELQTVSPPSTAPPKTMADDAAHIHGIVEALANDNKQILLVMHSYGGIPGTQAVKDLTAKERQEQGKGGGLTGLVYVSSLLINEGQSSDESFAPFAAATPPEFFRVSVRTFSFPWSENTKTMNEYNQLTANVRANISTWSPPEAQQLYLQTCQRK